MRYFFLDEKVSKKSRKIECWPRALPLPPPPIFQARPPFLVFLETKLGKQSQGQGSENHSSKLHNCLPQDPQGLLQFIHGNRQRWRNPDRMVVM